jgi:hypothetical protein
MMANKGFFCRMKLIIPVQAPGIPHLQGPLIFLIPEINKKSTPLCSFSYVRELS